MLEHLSTRGVGPAKQMAMDFGPRLNVLTGDNGLGKTFVLDAAWWVMTDRWADVPLWVRPPGTELPADQSPSVTFSHGPHEAEPYGAVYSWRSQDWGRPSRAELPDCVVLYAQPGWGFCAWHPLRRTPVRPISSQSPLASRSAYSFKGDEVWNGLPSNDDQRWLCNGLIRDWVTWQERGSEEYTALTSVLEVLSPSDDERLEPGEPTRVWLDDARDYPTLRLPYGEVPVTQTSAAIRRVLALSYLLVWTWHEHRRAAALANQAPARDLVLLVDECEAHLHPQWQRRIVPSLLQVTSKLPDTPNVQLLVTTHSPLVLASCEEAWDPKLDRLFSFELVDGEAQVHALDFRPRGDACRWLTSEVFGLPTARGLPQEEALDRAMALVKRSDASVDEVREVHDRLRELLPDTDPIWPRWLIYAERQGLDV